jgi:hypothetical protein
MPTYNETASKTLVDFTDPMRPDDSALITELVSRGYTWLTAEGEARQTVFSTAQDEARYTRLAYEAAADGDVVGKWVVPTDADVVIVSLV